MKNIRTFSLFSLFTLLIAAQAYAQCGNLYIAGVIDGPLTGGTPKGIQLCASGTIADLSLYGIGSANNGGGTDGQEFTFPTTTLNIGDCIWLASESTQFTTYLGFSPCYVDGTASINGDDAIELFCNGAVEDIFGDINCDPNNGSGCETTPTWEHTDSWAVSNDAVANPVFDIAEWTVAPVNTLDGTATNAGAGTPYPNTNSNCPAAVCGISNVTLTVVPVCNGDDATYTVCADVADGSGAYDLVDTDNANAVIASLTGQVATGNICFAVTVPGPVAATALNVDVLDNADPTCIGGTPIMVNTPACPLTVCTITNVTLTADGVCSGDNATYTVCADVAIGSGDYDLVDVNNANAVLASLTAQPDGNICFNAVAIGPTSAGTISVDVVDNTDGSCSSGTPVTVTIPECPVNCPVAIISEFHYDNSGGDVGEFVEIAVPAGADVSNITVYLINGSGVIDYDNIAMSTLSPTTDGVNDYYVWSGMTSIQNGPDGILLECNGSILDFVSYEGVLMNPTVQGTLLTGTSTDVGVTEPGFNTNTSIQLIGGAWILCEEVPTTGAANACVPAVCPTNIITFPANGN